MTNIEPRLMARAIQLARRGLYTSDPNPRVGCVISDPTGNIVGEGWHQYAGKPHAEINALAQVSSDQRSACTAYVSLEPCCHQGKTGPCTQALISAKISRVVVAMLDPNPLVAGKGIQALNAAGIPTKVGVLQAQAEALNPGFIKRMRTSLPLLRMKVAMSLDGRTALASGESQWITSKDSRRDVHKLRARSSGLLTGIGTVLQDDPLLNARLHEDQDVVQPIRVILDTRLQISPTAKLFSVDGRVVIYTCNTDVEKQRALTAAGADVHQVANKNGHTDLAQVLSHLAKHYETNEITVEAGATLCGVLVQSGWVDQLIVYMAPSLLGNEARAAFNFLGVDTMQKKVQLENLQSRMIGSDIRITVDIRYDD